MARGRRSRRRRSPRPRRCSLRHDPALQSDQVSNVLTRSAADADRDTGCVRCYDGPRRAHRLGTARHRQRRQSARTIRSRRRTATRRTTGPRRPPRSGAARASGSRPRSTTGTIGTTSTRSRSARAAARRPPARARRRELGSLPLEARNDAASADPPSPSGSWPHSPGRPDRWSRIRLRVRQSGWYYLVVKIASPGSGQYTLRYRKRPRAPAPSSSSVATSRICRAGLPTTTARGRHVAHDDCAGSDVGLFADLDPGAEHRAAADACAAPDRRPAAELVPLLGPAHEVVVRRDHARRDEDLVLERRVGGDVGVGLDLRQRADRRVVLDERAAPDDDVVADLAALADARLVADDHALADTSSRRRRSRPPRRSSPRRARAAAAPRGPLSSAARAPAACRRPRGPRSRSLPRSPCPG